MKKLIPSVIALALALAVELFPAASQAATVLDPQNPTTTFTKEGNESFTSGAVLTLTDGASSDFVAFLAADIDAVAGTETDVIATFQIRQTVPNNADAGNRVVINDGAMRSAIAACIMIGERGIGLLSQGNPSQPNSYPVVVPVDWQDPVTIRLRRHANGDAELIEVNGVTPSPRAILLAAQCPAFTRTFSSVEFGCRSVQARCTVDYSAFRSERPATAVPQGEHGSRETMISASPNPTAGALSIAFAVPRGEVARLGVYDITGGLVRTLWSGPVGGQTQSNLSWDGRDDASQRVAAGTYFLRLESPEVRETKKVVLIR